MWPKCGKRLLCFNILSIFCVMISLYLYFKLDQEQDKIESNNEEVNNNIRTESTKTDIFVTSFEFLNAMNGPIVQPEMNVGDPTHLPVPDGSMISMKDDTVKKEHPIVIGIISCDKIESFKSATLASNLMKSIILSAETYAISGLDIHVFIESDTTDYFQKKLSEFGYENSSIQSKVQVNMFFHPILDSVPERLRERFLSNQHNLHVRGGVAKLFYSVSLPDVDSIIHLDTDVIITGNIQQLWSHLGKMNKEQMVGVNHAAHKDMELIDPKNVLIEPNGVDTAVIVMNLTKMREVKWEKMTLHLYESLKKTMDFKHTEGRLMNVVLGFNQHFIVFLPCHMNFQSEYCQDGSTCKEASVDPIGIHLIQSDAGALERKVATYYKLFELYEKFDMKSGNITKDLMAPIRSFYSRGARYLRNRCFEFIGEHLFKMHFPNE